MCASAVQSDYPQVMLHGVSREMYEGILDALEHYSLRHTFDGGELEMRGVLCGVESSDYMRLLEALGDYDLRHTFDQGTLEMMSPQKEHDWIKSILSRMLEAMALELDIDIQTMGSTTITGKDGEFGLQPDEAYYIAHESNVRGKDVFDPTIDPPPDLIIEVDVTSSSVRRMPLFARLGVAEIWRHEAKKLHFYSLKQTAGPYQEIEKSVAFPFLSPNDVEKFLEQRHTMRENALVRAFVKYVTDELLNRSKQ